MALSLDLESVRDFIRSHGGKARNHDVVTHFKEFLNDPELRDKNREKFKEYINKLAAVKTEHGEKMLILKKKYRQNPSSERGPPTSSQDSSQAGSGQNSETASIGSVSSSTSREASVEAVVTPGIDSPNGSVEPDRSETSSIGSSNTCDTRESSVGMDADVSRESSMSAEDRGVQEESPIISVKDRATFLNKLQTMDEEEEEPKVELRKKAKVEKQASSYYSEDPTESLTLSDPVERQWMSLSAKADYHPMARMLQDHPQLAKKKELTSGYTALHWACKHGKGELVKLLAGTHEAPVNARSHGGYSPLHMAALHGHEDLIELLVQTYGADVNIRDNSGKKPKHYLKISAQAHTQHLLQSIKKNEPVVDDIESTANVNSRTSKNQGALSAFLMPINNNIRASFRRKTSSSSREKSPRRSPNMFRRASAKDLTGGAPESTRKNSKFKKRAVSEQLEMPRAASDPDMKKSFFI